MPPFVGMERHKCSISPLEMNKLIYFALLAEGFPATEELNQVIILVKNFFKKLNVVTLISMAFISLRIRIGFCLDH